MTGRRMGRRRAERVVAAAQRLSLDATAKSGVPVTTAETLAARPRTALSPTAGRGSISTSAQDFYLQQSGVQFLLEDLVKRLQEERPDAPATFVGNYFAAVASGTHVQGRSFEYVNGTLQNQVAFVTQLQRGLAGVDTNMEVTSGDFAELVWNHCSDVPSVLLNQASSHLIGSPDGVATATIQHFLAAFAVCFIYNGAPILHLTTPWRFLPNVLTLSIEFLSKVYDVYSELVHTSLDAQTSSSPGSQRAESIASAMAADRVVAKMRLVAMQSTSPIPPLSEVESIVFKSTSFREFCSLFFVSPMISATIRDLQAAFTSLN